MLMLVASVSLRAETLVIAADIWCPINCATNTEQPGIFVELTREIFAESGIDVHYETRNWARVLQQVRSGEVNAAIGAGHEDAPDFLFTQTPVALSRNCFYTLSDSQWRFSGVESLQGVRLGVINDYSYGEALNAYVAAQRSDREGRVQVASGDRALALNLSKLRHRRIDVMIENTWVVQHQLREQGVEEGLREAGCRQPDMPIYLAFSPALKTSVEHVRIFEQGLRRYRESGRLAALLQRYGVSER